MTEIEWLEKNMNKTEIFYYEISKENLNLINCYFKDNNKCFATFYKDVINKLIEKGW